MTKQSKAKSDETMTEEQWNESRSQRIQSLNLSRMNLPLDDGSRRSHGIARLHFIVLNYRSLTVAEDKAIANLSNIDWWNPRTVHGQTPLHFLAAFAWQDQFLNEMLAKRNVAVNAQDKWGQTPLHYAVRHNQQDKAIKPLLRAGANPRITDRIGMTPLMALETEDCSSLINEEGHHCLKDAEWWRDTDFALEV